MFKAKLNLKDLQSSENRRVKQNENAKKEQKVVPAFKMIDQKVIQTLMNGLKGYVRQFDHRGEN